MAITGYAQVRSGNVTTVTATSDLVGTVYFNWYIDGAFVSVTTTPTMSFSLEPGDQVRIEAIDTNDQDFDSVANAPAGWPARRTLWWVRSVDADVVKYRVEQRKGAGAWSTVGVVPHDELQWSYWLMSPRLDDLSTYEWRVIPIDAAGNDGTATSIGPELIVRTPDAPRFSATFNPGATTVTLAAA